MVKIFIGDDKQRSIELARILLTFGGLTTLFIMQGHIWIGIFFGIMGLTLIANHK